PVITLPPGSYAVSFRWKPAALQPTAPRAVTTDAARRKRLLVAAGWLMLAALMGNGLYLTHTLRPNPTKAARPTVDPLWSWLFRPGQKTNIIMADAARYEVQELLGRDLTLRDYLGADYPENLLQAISPELQRVIRFMAQRQTTSIASVSTGTRFMEF